MILVIEDEPKIAAAIVDGLRRSGFDSEQATDGVSGLERAVGPGVSLIVLDLRLPGRDGLEVLRELRSRGIATPVLVLTARDTVEDRVRGLDAGADDYLVKPFAFPELLARARALLRRGPPRPEGLLECGALRVDPARREARCGEHVLTLTARELDLLILLLRHGGEVVSRETIARVVWNEPRRATTLDNVVDVHMSRLRRKLAACGLDPVRTVRGVGFRIETPE